MSADTSPEEEVLVRVVRALETEAIPYMSKLEWSRKAGGSEKQIADAVGVFAVNPRVDRLYIERWARELGILDLWQEITSGRPPEASSS